MTLPAGLHGAGDGLQTFGEGAGYELPPFTVGAGDLLGTVVGAAFPGFGVLEEVVRLFDDLRDVVRWNLVLVAGHLFMVTDVAGYGKFGRR